MIRANLLGLLLAAAAMLMVATAPVFAETIAQVTRTQGQAMVVSNGETRALAQGAVIEDDETLVTLDDSRLELKFIDGTVLTLGANATLRIDTYVFNKPGFTDRLAMYVEGAFRMITGLINKATGRAVTVNTPVAALSVRGTDFWSGPIDGIHGVLLVDGEVGVRTLGGEIVLSEPGTGTNITDATSAPGAVTTWPQDKIRRAISAVAFQ